MNQTTMANRLNSEEAAKYLDMSLGYLRNLLWKKSGPRHYKYLGRVWFEKKDLEAFKRSITQVRAG